MGFCKKREQSQHSCPIATWPPSARVRPDLSILAESDTHLDAIKKDILL